MVPFSKKDKVLTKNSYKRKKWSAVYDNTSKQRLDKDQVAAEDDRDTVDSSTYTISRFTSRR